MLRHPRSVERLAHDSELQKNYRTDRLTSSAEEYLFGWLHHRRNKADHDQVLQRIMGALEYNPDLLEEYEWPDIENMGRDLGF